MCTALLALTPSAFGAAQVRHGSGAATTSNTDPIVVTRGGAVRGVAVPGGYAFRGLPYAAAPTGNLRWRPPRHPASWSGIRDATHYAPSCPQKPNLFQPPGLQSEDCLYQVARNAASCVRPGGTLLFMGGTVGRRTAPGLSLVSALSVGKPALTKNLALELAPIRVNLIAAGFVDTPLSASLLGDQLENRRNQLRATLPIRRVVGPADVAALAVHIMTNTALTGATYDIDGGQQLVAGV
jgi:hypothetical protein